MLSIEQNEKLTQVGKGTPGGELMRRYWHPIAPVAELDERPTKAVRILGEDLVLYRDRSGTYGLIAKECPHRRMDMAYGIPEEHGLRCPYHGWMMDETGQCIEQPFEETVHPDGRFKEKVKVAGYPVQAKGGLLFAYLGPEPAPLLPLWDLVAQEKNVLREIFVAELPCNWVQCQENSLDPVHLEWLHGVFGTHLASLEGRRDVVAEAVGEYGQHKEIGFNTFEHGIIKRRVYGTGSREDGKWAIGHPVLFPNILQQGGGGRYLFQVRVPIDDERTLHFELTTYWFPDDVDVPPQTYVPYSRVGLYNPDGTLRGDDTIAQDHLAWISQGPIAKRDLEHLGESDRGIILFRKQLSEQMDMVAEGEDPINTFRDPDDYHIIHVDQEGWDTLGKGVVIDEVCRYGSKLYDQVKGLIEQTQHEVSGHTA